MIPETLTYTSCLAMASARGKFCCFVDERKITKFLEAKLDHDSIRWFSKITYTTWSLQM